ncbi:hypothetical protein ACFQL1_04515 [Halomicroarcula sp. GCM10025709]
MSCIGRPLVSTLEQTYRSASRGSAGHGPTVSSPVTGRRSP